MLQLSKEGALYSELDFPQFNPQGFRRVRQSVEVAQQAKDLARTAEELRAATSALRLANDIKIAEQRVAERNFEAEREKAFVALDAAVERYERTVASAPNRRELEDRLDHLITLFALKDFAAVHQGLPDLMKAVNRAGKPRYQSRYRNDQAHHRSGEVQSISSLFQRAMTLERAGHQREALELYGQIVQRDSHHRPAIERLRKLGDVRTYQSAKRKNRSSCKDNYRYYARGDRHRRRGGKEIRVATGFARKKNS
jgi:tetratricopeptide (TPR) repeat protein